MSHDSQSDQPLGVTGIEGLFRLAQQVAAPRTISSGQGLCLTEASGRNQRVV